MKMRKSVLAGAVMILGLCTSVAYAQGDLRQRASAVGETVKGILNEWDITTTESVAKQFDLTSEEWTRYELIMKGPRGYWSPNLDPLTALGVEARTEAERRRYAELQVRLEVARTERELAYQRAYDEAFLRLFPSLMPVQMGTLKPAVTSGGRLTLFVKPACPACDQQAKRLQGQGVEFDIYMLETAGKDDTIRSWAKTTGIDPQRVKSRQITLNHDNGTWSQVSGGKGQVPGLYKRVAGQWQRVE